MSSSRLLRALPAPPTRLQTTRAFSTSLPAQLPPKKGQAAAPKKKSSSFAKKGQNKNVKQRVDATVPTNRYDALKLPSADLSFMPAFLPDHLTPSALGMPHRFVGPALDVLNHVGVPRTLQREFDVLPEPHAVVRQATLDVLDLVDKAGKTPSRQNRVVLHGPPGSGRSVTLFQAVSYALSSSYITLYVPSSQDLVSSLYSYAPPSPSSPSSTWAQPTLAALLLARLGATNADALANVQTTQEWAGGRVKKGEPLKALVDLGARVEGVAQGVLEGVLQELGTQDKYPVLLAIDTLQALYQPSLYRDPHFNKLQPYQLGVPALLLSYLSGRSSFNRGLILSALSSTPTHFPVPALLSAALDTNPARPVSAFARWDARHVANAAGLRGLDVGALGVQEARGLFEGLGRSGGLHTPMSDEFFLSKYTEAGGNVKAFARGLTRTFQ